MRDIGRFSASVVLAVAVAGGLAVIATNFGADFAVAVALLGGFYCGRFVGRREQAEQERRARLRARAWQDVRRGS